jgi:ABC-2 type transport system ATP-binding protein
MLLEMDLVRFQAVTKVFRQRTGLSGLFFKDRAAGTTALNNVDLAVQEGEILALLGPNGSGKTTLLKLVSTMLLPDSGAVVVSGHDTQREAGLVRRQVGIAVANERSFYPRLTAFENLDFFGTLEDIPKVPRRKRIGELLELMKLVDARSKLVMEFSTGMYQRLGVARALLKSPKVLLLDEPTRSLDPEATMRLWEIMKETAERGTTLIVASHDFEEAALADRFCVLDRGVIKDVARASGTTLEQIRQKYFSAVHS